MDAQSRVATLLSSLADPSRLRVLGVLAEGDFCVSEIAGRIGLSQSCTTRHLQTLQKAGVLTRARDGKRVLFRIRSGDAELDRLLEVVLLRRPLSADRPRSHGPSVGPPVRQPQPTASARPSLPTTWSPSDTPGASVASNGAPEPPAASEDVAEPAVELEDYLL